MTRAVGIKYLSASDVVVVSPERGYFVIQQRHLYFVLIARISVALPLNLHRVSHGTMHENRMNLLRYHCLLSEKIVDGECSTHG